MEDKILISLIEDRQKRCDTRGIMTSTFFLDMRQRTMADNLLRNRGCRYCFDGGYEDAERSVLVFLPDYLEEYSREEGAVISLIRVSTDKKPRPLTHRDYLGSLMSLGIKRECIGDILVTDRGADILVLNEMLEYLLMNYVQAGHTRLSVQELPLSEICLPEQKTREKLDTVASLRLDGIVASAFGGSRAAAASGIKAGLVFVNSLQVLKPDFRLKEGDKITFRGKGRAVLSEVGGESRKNRIHINLTIYI